MASPIEEMNISMDKKINKKEDEMKESLHSTKPSNNHPTYIQQSQSTNIQRIQSKQTKVPKKMKPKWRRADKRREISENIYINPQYEYIYHKILIANRENIKNGIKEGNPSEQLKIALMKI